MKIVQGSDVEWKRGLQHRGGMFHYRNLMQGDAGSLGNFQLSMGRSDRDFLSPRHRHNFEQFRFQLEGELSFGRDGVMKPGMVGYFPEGAHYGPQTQENDAITIVLQFGGASGQGYLSRAEVMAGMKALEAHGAFKDGVYRRHEGAPGKRNMDAYQAIWEHVNGRAMDYPKARYPGPVMMDSSHFEWVANAREPGVAEKMLGYFTERQSAGGFLKVDAGAQTQLPQRSLHVCLSGGGNIDGQDVRALTTIYLADGEQARFTAAQDSLFIKMLLPDLRGLERPAGQALPAAAE